MLTLVCFRLVAAPLNPNYTKSEVLFYLQDTQSKLLVLPVGSLASNSAAVQAAKEAQVPVVEIAFDRSACSITLLDANGKPVRRAGMVRLPSADQTALFLHTSGTTGRPKCVPLSHSNLARTMSNIIQTVSTLDSSRRR